MATTELSPPAVEAVYRLEPPGRGVDLDLGTLWEYRQLLYFFTWRDVKVRYKQTVLGAAWAILQPLLTTFIFTIFFGHVAGLSSDGVPYVLFAFAALLPWTYFSNGLSAASNSLVSGASMITKVYFPRLALPIAAVLGAVVDLICAATLLIPLFVYYDVALGVRILALPLFFLIATTTCIGTGLAFAALNVRYRDVRYVVPFLVQAWLFATPVVYSSNTLSSSWRAVYAINPMVGVVDGFRWSLLGISSHELLRSVLVSTASALTLLVLGLVYFRRSEDSFADVI